MIHHVFANRANIGDWLSARGIGRLLSAHEDRVELLCDGPFLPGTLAALGDEHDPPDLVVVGGGGLLMDYFDPLWEGLAQLAPRVPVVLWGIGLCDLKDEHSLPERTAVHAVAEASVLCVVRDERTRAFLAPAVDAAIAPCPSFAAIPWREGAGSGVLHATSLTTVGEAADHVMRAAAALVADPDEVVHETSNEIRPGNEDDLAAVVERYATSRVVLSARLHGCILAVATGRPLLAVSGDHKVEEFMTSVGLGHHLLEAVEAVAMGPRRLAERVAAAAGAPPDARLAAHAQARNEEIADRVLALADRRRRRSTRSRRGAIDAWVRLGGSPATTARLRPDPQSLGPATFRLEDPAAGRVLARRGQRQAVAREARLLTEVLAPRNIGPRCFGALHDQISPEHGWIFVEDLEASSWDPAREDHNRAAAAWLGHLHGTTEGLDVDGIPSIGLAAHRDALRRVLVALGSAGRPAPGAADPFADLRKLCGRAAALWPAAEVLADELPKSLVHGSFSARSVQFGEGLVPVVSGWEHARIGSPAEDARRVDVDAYVTGLVAGGWRASSNMTEAMVRLGAVLADLEILDEYASGLHDAWLPTYVPQMWEYAASVERGLSSLRHS